MKKLKSLAMVLGITVLFAACSNGSDSGSSGGSGGGEGGSTYTLKTTEPSERDKVLNIVDVMDNIQIDQVYDTSAYKGKKAFLVVTNNSEEIKEVYKKQSSSVNSLNSRNAASSNDIQTNKGKYVNIPYNPPEIKCHFIPESNSNANKFNKNEYLNKNARAAIGDREDFYAFDKNNKISTELAKNAVLKAIGQHCNVWYVSKSGISVNDSALKTLAETFDKIFEYETYIFGSNVPAPVVNTEGVIIPVTEETKIDIIVYDLFGDYKETKNTGAGTFGYFTALDLWVEDEQYGTSGSNQSEALHIDSYFLQVAPKMVQSTIAHEFQHLLHYINKCINQELEEYETADGQTGYTFRNTETWFTEMMSMVCEDIMQDVIGLEDEESPKGRLPQFNYNYQLGFTTWRDNNPNDYTEVMYSYANAYTFGAYLIRNFGFDFIRNLATNEYTKGREAISEALKNCSNDADVKSFEAALDKYYNVVLNPKGSKYTLNKKAEKTYTDVGGDKPVTFKCSAINLYDYITVYAKYITNDSNILNMWYEAKADTDYCGPYILNNRYFYELDPTGMSVSYAGVITEDTYKLPSQYFNKDDSLNYKVVFFDDEVQE